MPINTYIEKINKLYKTGIATEHTYRGDLKWLIESIVPEITATNEPKRIECGAPDYILTRKALSLDNRDRQIIEHKYLTKNEIPVALLEAKDVGSKDLEGKKANKEQFDRYKGTKFPVIFTDYLDFHFYLDGVFVTQIAIGEISGKGIKSIPENFIAFENLIKKFCTYIAQTIKSPKTLAEMMAGQARLLSDIMERALCSDESHNEDSSLKDQLIAFKEVLIHDITPKGFADVYAQTIAYGMFAARLHDPTLETFSRQEAAELIPKTNPFLRKLFGYIAGPDIDDRIKWVVDGLVKIFLACNVEELLKHDEADPIIYFYETFLSEYDPKLRKSKGVWYTPAPVVNFIVRAVDDILKTEFGLPQGLADSMRRNVTSHSESKQNVISNSESMQKDQSFHKVQILDPATGTGTFLAEVISQIQKKFIGQEGIWSNYVETHLFPRINGFEILMASYAMAHLKLDLLLKDSGYKPTKDQRFRVYLTNSLEEHHPDTGTLFASWLSNEANEANHIKRDTPVMVVIGNPPYSGESANKGEWIMGLMEDYKKEPGGKEKLKEKNPKWVNDDYVKFIRYGQYFIEKNGTGILAFINPHGFLDNPTFRGMRWNLLKTYDKIYTIDLHGNSKKKETCPDGSVDENVFDIMQGVSINIFVKTGKRIHHGGHGEHGDLGKVGGQTCLDVVQHKFLSDHTKENLPLAKVYHYDLYGKREYKYEFLMKNSISSVPYKEIPNKAPMYYMVQKNFDVEAEYNKGFSLKELFLVNSVGVVTARDGFTIHKSEEDVKKTIDEFIRLDDESARIKFNLGKDVRDWQVGYAKEDLKKHYPDKGHFTKINYRPFDERWTFYTGKSKGFHCMPRGDVMQHFIKGENVGLVFKRGGIEELSSPIFLSKNIIEFRSWSRPGMQGGDFIAPLYLYNDYSSRRHVTSATRDMTLDTDFQPNIIDQGGRPTPNLNMEIVDKIVKGLGLKFDVEIVNDKEHGNTSQGEQAIVRCNVQYPLDGTNIVSVHEINKDQQNFRGESVVKPTDLLDYIYAVLHSPSYREKYKEFLKIDFPRVPYPANVDRFWRLVDYGSQLRLLHLMEFEVGMVNDTERRNTSQANKRLFACNVQYPIDGTNIVEKVKFEPNLSSSPEPDQPNLRVPRVLRGKKNAYGRVFINETQYFDNVPEVAWEFYIGGYQPAQKWLKDRISKVGE